MSNESLREKIIKALLETSNSMRFTELYNDVDRPSKSHFSQELHQLQTDGVVLREQIDYKHVEYSLDRDAYEKWLLEEQRKLDEKLKRTKAKQNGK